MYSLLAIIYTERLYILCIPLSGCMRMYATWGILDLLCISLFLTCTVDIYVMMDGRISKTPRRSSQLPNQTKVVFCQVRHQLGWSGCPDTFALGDCTYSRRLYMLQTLPYIPFFETLGEIETFSGVEINSRNRPKIKIPFNAKTQSGDSPRNISRQGVFLKFEKNYILRHMQKELCALHIICTTKAM